MHEIWSRGVGILCLLSGVEKIFTKSKKIFLQNNWFVNQLQCWQSTKYQLWKEKCFPFHINNPFYFCLFTPFNNFLLKEVLCFSLYLLCYNNISQYQSFFNPLSMNKHKAPKNIKDNWQIQCFKLTLFSLNSLLHIRIYRTYSQIYLFYIFLEWGPP